MLLGPFIEVPIFKQYILPLRVLKHRFRGVVLFDVVSLFVVRHGRFFVGACSVDSAGESSIEWQTSNVGFVNLIYVGHVTNRGVILRS